MSLPEQSIVVYLGYYCYDPATDSATYKEKPAIEIAKHHYKNIDPYEE